MERSWPCTMNRGSPLMSGSVDGLISLVDECLWSGLNLMDASLKLIEAEPLHLPSPQLFFFMFSSWLKGIIVIVLLLVFRKF